MTKLAQLPKTQHRARAGLPASLAATIAEAMRESGIDADEIATTTAALPASSRQVTRREARAARKVNSVGMREHARKLEERAGPLEREEPETRGRLEQPEDPWKRRSSRAFLLACEKVARVAGETWTPPPSVPRRVWIGTQAIAQSTRTARHSLCELPRGYAQQIRRALDGLSLEHVTARLIVAYAWALWRLSVRARRQGYARRVEGIPRGLLACLVRNPATGEKYSVSRLFGTDTNAGRGIIVRLDDAGALLKLQTPAHKAPARLKGPSGHAFSVYWIPTTTTEAAAHAAPSSPETDPSAPAAAPSPPGDDPPP